METGRKTMRWRASCQKTTRRGDGVRSRHGEAGRGEGGWGGLTCDSVLCLRSHLHPHSRLRSRDSFNPAGFCYQRLTHKPVDRILNGSLEPVVDRPCPFRTSGFSATEKHLVIDGVGRDDPIAVPFWDSRSVALSGTVRSLSPLLVVNSTFDSQFGRL